MNVDRNLFQCLLATIADKGSWATSVVDRLQASKIETNLNKPAVGYFVVLHIAITIKGIVTRTPPVAFVRINYEPLIRMFLLQILKTSVSYFVMLRARSD